MQLSTGFKKKVVSVAVSFDGFKRKLDKVDLLAGIFLSAIYYFESS